MSGKREENTGKRGSRGRDEWQMKERRAMMGRTREEKRNNKWRGSRGWGVKVRQKRRGVTGRGGQR